MKKYYVGFAVLLAACIVALVYAVGQGSAAKTDHATDKAVDQISQKLGYNSTVPVSLAAAGVTDLPPTVQYTRLDDSSYKICFDYKNAAGGFDAGWTGLFLGSFGDSRFGGDMPQDNSYFSSSVEFSHKKGQNCQTVKPYIYNSQPNDNLNSKYDQYQQCVSGQGQYANTTITGTCEDVLNAN